MYLSQKNWSLVGEDDSPLVVVHMYHIDHIFQIELDKDREL